MELVATFIQTIINFGIALKEFFTADITKYIGKFSSLLSAIGINLNGYSLIGILGGSVIFVLIIYSIIKK